jgi:hypothetical protein
LSLTVSSFSFVSRPSVHHTFKMRTLSNLRFIEGTAEGRLAIEVWKADPPWNGELSEGLHQTSSAISRWPPKLHPNNKYHRFK